VTRNRKGAVCTALFIAVLAILPAAPARAGFEVYRDGDKFVEIGGRIQLQYHAVDPDGGDSEDEIFFRRLRPYIEAGIRKDWLAKIEFDVGDAAGTNEVAVKDSYVRYTGFKAADFTLGNQKAGFSRSFLISSKEQEVVERPFVGDHNYGVPNHMLGALLDGKALGDKLVWVASLGSASIDPDARRVDFDTPANSEDDFNQGWLTVGRLELHPLGPTKSGQGDLSHGPLRVVVATSAFSWSNDDDNNTYTAAGNVATSASKADVDQVTGYELSAGLRGSGLSADVEFNVIDADTVDPRFTGGVYVDGSTQLEQLAVQAGYMVIANRLEVVGTWESQDADGYTDTWTRTSFGLNYFVDAHKLKSQLTYRMGENLDGVPGKDADELFLQFQYAF